MRSGRDIPGAGGPGNTEPPEAPTFPSEAIRPTLVGIVGTMLAAWTVGGMLRLMWTPRPLVVAIYYLVVFGGLIRTVGLASSRWGSGSFRVDFGWWARLSDAVRAVPIMWLGSFAGALAVIPWHGRWASNADWLSTADGASVVVFAAFAVVAAPLFEELVFRGLLQRALTSRFGARWAIVLQGVVFGLYHFKPTGGVDNLPNMVFIAAWGCVMGLAVHRYRRLGPTMLAHALTNIMVTAALIG